MTIVRCIPPWSHTIEKNTPSFIHCLQDKSQRIRAAPERLDPPVPSEAASFAARSARGPYPTVRIHGYNSLSAQVNVRRSKDHFSVTCMLLSAISERWQCFAGVLFSARTIEKEGKWHRELFVQHSCLHPRRMDIIM